jgi:large subunit ribosomal protein L21
VKIFKKIRRQGYRRTRGHRQTETVLRVTEVAGAGKTDKWEGTVDLTTKAELNARSRNLKFVAPVAADAAPAAKVEAPAKAAPKKAAAPKAAKADDAAAPAKKAAPKKAAAKKEADEA